MLLTISCKLNPLPPPSQPHLSHLPGPAIVNTIFALASCPERPTRDWMDQAAAALTPLTRDLAPEDAARCLWALAKLDHSSGGNLVEALTQRLRSDSDSPENNMSPAASPEPPDNQLTESASALSHSSLSSDVSLPAAVDAVWGLSHLGAPVPPLWVAELFTRLNGKVQALDGGQVSRLLTALSALGASPPPTLASELGKSASMRFTSPSVPPAELADMVWAFARLGVKLPPAFAASAQRRLQVHTIFTLALVP